MQKVHLSLSTIVLILTILTTAFPIGAEAGIRPPFHYIPDTLRTAWMFHPVIYGYTGEAGLELVYEKDENKSNGQGLDTSNKEAAFTTEFKVGGYSYHPRFMLFLARVLGRYLWEDYKSNQRGVTRTYTKMDYELRAAILPKHPYNAELYTLKQTTFVRRSIEAGYRPVNTQKGFIVNYEKRPWLFSINYSDESIEQNDANDTRSDTKTWRYNGTFFKGPLHAFGTYTRQDSFDTFTLIDGELDQYALEKRVRWKGVNLTSRLQKSRFIQVSPLTPDLRDDLMIWTEEVSMDLAWNLRTFADFRHYEDKQFTGGFEGFPPQLFDTQTNSASWNVNHRLFESLITSYNLNHVYSKVNQGVSENLTNNIRFDYRKKIPWGLFTAGFGFMRDISEARGTPTVVGEEHVVRLFDRFELEHQGVNSTTVSVQIVDENGHRTPLEENVHYFIFPFGNTIEIQLFDVPAANRLVDPLATYKLLVSYETEGDYKLRSEETSYKAGLFLLRGLVQPYWSYSRYKQKVLEGIYTGGPESARRTTYGIASAFGFWDGFVEHTEVESRYRPYDETKGQVTYRRKFNGGGRLHARLRYLDKSYRKGELSPQSLVYTEKQWGIQAQYSKNILKKGLSYTLSGSYQKTSSYSDSRTYSMDWSLNWRVGKLRVDLSAGLTNTSSKIRDETQTIEDKYIYLTIKRRLF